MPVGGNCLAAGSYLGDNPDDNGPLLVSDTTGGWKTSVRPPAGALPGNSANSLASVSCASASSCTAVGAYKDAKGQLPLVATETGPDWLASADVTLPANGAFWDTGAFAGVSCARLGQCVAVGDYETGGGSNQGLGAVQSGATWKATEIAFGGTAQLDAVSCVASACLAVGHGVGKGDGPAGPRRGRVGGPLQLSPYGQGPGQLERHCHLLDERLLHGPSLWSAPISPHHHRHQYSDGDRRGRRHLGACRGDRAADRGARQRIELADRGLVRVERGL